MMKIEIRMAQTGHSEKICVDPASKGEIVYTHINKIYKILPKDQLVITKIGLVIRQEQQLKKQLSQLRRDQTLASKHMSQNHTNSNQLISCIYFFNLKEFALKNQKNESAPMEYWQNELEEKLNIVKHLRPMVSSFETLQKHFSVDKIQQFDKITKKISSLQKQLVKFQDRCLNMKDIQLKIQQIIQRCNNQKNSCNSLFKSLQQFVDQQVVKPIANFFALQKQLENSFITNSNNLRQNSSFFQNKKNMQSSTKLYGNKIQQMKANFQRDKAQIKIEVRKGRHKFRPVDERVTQFGKNTYMKVLEQSVNNSRDDYNNIIYLFKSILQGSASEPLQKLERDIDSLSKSIKDQKEEDINKSQKILKLKYIEFSLLNEENRNIIKQVYQIFLQMKMKFSSYRQQIIQLQKDITEQLKKQQLKKYRIMLPLSDNLGNELIDKNVANKISQGQINELSFESQIELKRRICFNRRLNFIHSFVDKICAQQQVQRRKFIQNAKKQGRGQNIFLNNMKVPFIDIDYDGTTDLQVLKSSRSSKTSQFNKNQITIQEFLILEYGQIVDIINKITKQNQSIKVNNMINIIKKMSDLFAKVYNKKYNQLQQNTTKLVQNIGNLQENIIKLQRNLYQNNMRYKQLQKSIEQKQIRIVQLNKQLNLQKSKGQRLSMDLSCLKKDLKKQAEINNTLCEQLAKYEQQSQNNKIQFSDFKLLLGVKQVEICRLQEQLNSQQMQKQQRKKDHSNLFDGQIKNQIDLKSIVMQQFNTQPNNQELKRLNEQIAYLESENQQLQQQFDTLSAEMRKIIMKSTQDTSIQTDSVQIFSQYKLKQQAFHDRANQLKNQRISIDQEILVGQNALFIPFDNNQYMGVHYKDEDKTLCNINNLQNNSYILDILSFPRTTRQLLIQCSFLVILKVTDVIKQNRKSLVKGKIIYMFGFEDESTIIKNYAGFLAAE